jgi:hypothetical protein
VYFGGDSYETVSYKCHYVFCDEEVLYMFYVQNCSSGIDGLSLRCISPHLPSLRELPGTRRRRGKDDAMLLNYTVVMDQAPGPNDSVALYLKPDPVFVEIADDSRVFSGQSITITVSI